MAYHMSQGVASADAFTHEEKQRHGDHPFVAEARHKLFRGQYPCAHEQDAYREHDKSRPHQVCDQDSKHHKECCQDKKNFKILHFNLITGLGDCFGLPGIFPV